MLSFKLIFDYPEMVNLSYLINRELDKQKLRFEDLRSNDIDFLSCKSYISDLTNLNNKLEKAYDKGSNNEK